MLKAGRWLLEGRGRGWGCGAGDPPTGVLSYGCGGGARGLRLKRQPGSRLFQEDPGIV